MASKFGKMDAFSRGGDADEKLPAPGTAHAGHRRPNSMGRRGNVIVGFCIVAVSAVILFVGAKMLQHETNYLALAQKYSIIVDKFDAIEAVEVPEHKVEARQLPEGASIVATTSTSTHPCTSSTIYITSTSGGYLATSVGVPTSVESVYTSAPDTSVPVTMGHSIETTTETETIIISPSTLTSPGVPTEISSAEPVSTESGELTTSVTATVPTVSITPSVSDCGCSYVTVVVGTTNLELSTLTSTYVFTTNSRTFTVSEPVVVTETAPFVTPSSSPSFKTSAASPIFGSLTSTETETETETDAFVFPTPEVSSRPPFPTTAPFGNFTTTTAYSTGGFRTTPTPAHTPPVIAGAGRAGGSASCCIAMLIAAAITLII